MLKRLEIGKLYRYIPTRAIAVVSSIKDGMICSDGKMSGGKVYRLIYLNEPDRVLNLSVKNPNQQLALWEEVGDPDCYNSSLAY